MWEAQADLDFTSADGSLRFEQRLERWSGAKPAALYGRRLIVRDVASDAILLDSRDWPVVEASAREDGSIDVRFSLFIEGSDVLFRIDPRKRSVRDVGLNGEPIPLSDLQAASDAAHREMELFTRWHYDSYTRRYISRDGKLRVEVHHHEPDRARASSFTTIFETASGQQIADLEDPNWSSWLQPLRDEISGLGKLSVSQIGLFAWADFVLEPATMSFRANCDHREQKPLSELRKAIPASLEANATERRRASPPPKSTLDKPLIFIAGAVIGAFLGFIAFHLLA